MDWFNPKPVTDLPASWDSEAVGDYLTDLVKKDLKDEKVGLQNRPKTMEEFLLQIPSVPGREVARMHIANYNAGYITHDNGADLCPCCFHLIEVPPNSLMHDFQSGDVLLYPPSKVSAAHNVPRTSSPSLSNVSSSEPDSFITLDKTGFSNMDCSRDSEGPRSPLVSPIKSPPLESGLILRNTCPFVLPHPRKIVDIPLLGLHKPGKMYHRPVSQDVGDIIKFQGKSIPIVPAKYYSHELGPPALYSHTTYPEIIGQEVFLQLKQYMQGSYSVESLLREMALAVKFILMTNNEANFIHSIDIVICPVELRSRRCMVYGFTAVKPHGPGGRVSAVVRLKESCLSDPLTVINTFLHEFAHALEPCMDDSAVGRDCHDQLWVNVYARLIRELNRAPHGKGLRLIRDTIAKQDLTWSDVLPIYPFGIV